MRSGQRDTPGRHGRQLREFPREHKGNIVPGLSGGEFSKSADSVGNVFSRFTEITLSQVSNAAHHLDSVIENLLKQQSGVEGTDYYKHLTEAFEGPFCDVSLLHYQYEHCKVGNFVFFFDNRR